MRITRLAATINTPAPISLAVQDPTTSWTSSWCEIWCSNQFTPQNLYGQPKNFKRQYTNRCVFAIILHPCTLAGNEFGFKIGATDLDQRSPVNDPQEPRIQMSLRRDHDTSLWIQIDETSILRRRHENYQQAFKDVPLTRSQGFFANKTNDTTIDHWGRWGGNVSPTRPQGTSITSDVITMVRNFGAFTSLQWDPTEHVQVCLTPCAIPVLNFSVISLWIELF